MVKLQNLVRIKSLPKINLTRICQKRQERCVCAQKRATNQTNAKTNCGGGAKKWGRKMGEIGGESGNEWDK